MTGTKGEIKKDLNMADRTSACIFGELFEYLANRPATPERNRFAKHVWAQHTDYDFSDDQMNCDAALIELGFARMEVDSEGDKVTTYKGVK